MRIADDKPHASRELQRLQKNLSELATRNPLLKEVAQLQRRVRELAHFPLPPSSVNWLASTNRTLRAFRASGENPAKLTAALADIEALRNELAHSTHNLRADEHAKPAYSLEEDGHG